MQSVVIEDFGGLDLRSDPGSSSNAIDLLNVVFEPGVVRSRPGTSILTAPGVFADLPLFVKKHPVIQAVGVDQLIVGLSVNLSGLRAYNSGGTLLAQTNFTVPPGGVPSTTIGTPTATYTYVAGASGVRRWDGTTWTTPAVFAATPTIHALGVSPSDNRMAVAHSDSTVMFSDPGAPETYGANNFVRLTPGDGERIRGMAVFNNQLFVFKRTKFFVFYGQSVGTIGQPIFNYRTVDSGIGMAVLSPTAVDTGPDGVYFVGADGLYRTGGGMPQSVSRPLDLFLGHRATLFYTGPAVPWSLNLTTVTLAWVEDVLYMVSANGDVFVFEPLLGSWSVWQFSAAITSVSSIVPAAATAGGEVPVFVDGADTMRYLDSASTTDAQLPIPAFTSRYRSPFMSLGTSRVKRLAHTTLDGIGAPTLRWSKDWGALTTGSAVTLGASPAVAAGRQTQAIRGRNFSFQIGSSGPAWALHRLQADISEPPRAPGQAVA